jgi:hypothetical protein
VSERPSLDDARDKVGWAYKHLHALSGGVLPFEDADAHTIGVEVNAEAGEYIFYVHDLGEPDPEWGLIIGDCVHNARSALDYLMVRLVSLITGQTPRDIESVQFPIETNPEKFAGRIGSLRKQHPVFSGYLTRIEELQPFNQGNPSVWGINADGSPLMHPLPGGLHRLAALDNIDKHRVVHATWLAVSFLRGMPERLPLDLFPPQFKLVGTTIRNEPLVDGAEIGRLHFETPLPFDWKPEQVDMQRDFPVHVAFQDPPAPVLDVLWHCLSSVDSVLWLFKPVFESGQPPLPVTAIEVPPFPPR